MLDNLKSKVKNDRVDNNNLNKDPMNSTITSLETRKKYRYYHAQHANVQKNQNSFMILHQSNVNSAPSDKDKEKGNDMVWITLLNLVFLKRFSRVEIQTN